jgi:hypothetical protein
MEQRVFGNFSAADLVLFRGFLSRFIAAFEGE